MSDRRDLSLIAWDGVDRALRQARRVRLVGEVQRVTGGVVEATLPGAALGTVVRIAAPHGGCVAAEVVAVTAGRVVLMPLHDVAGVVAGAAVVASGFDASVPVGYDFVGRVVDAWGQPLDGRPPPPPQLRYPLDPTPLNPMERGVVDRPLAVGVRAIDALLSAGEGQRVAIMAGAGVGKSTLLGMMARHTAADVTVIALVGERSREVRHFVEVELGEPGLERAVVVVATSDAAASLRIRAAKVAMALAEFFRDQGLRVLLLMDSLTRVAMAQREVGLAVGEPPTTRGYPPSAFGVLPRLLERAGPGLEGTGSITGFFSVLLERDDLNDPIGDAVRAIVDGHIVLSRKRADRGEFPAIDPLASISRVMPDVVTPKHLEAAMAFRRLWADLTDARELRELGAWQPGAAPHLDRALEAEEELVAFLRQRPAEAVIWHETVERLEALVARWGGAPKGKGGGR